MKVIMCPDDRSPYLERLIKGLQEVEIDIVGIPKFVMTNLISDLFKLYKEGITADIIHFHWVLPTPCKTATEMNTIHPPHTG